jgi:hypothetical protein
MPHLTSNQTSHALIRFCIYGRSRTREISQQLFRAGLFSILLGLFEGELRAENDFAPRFEEIKKAATDEQLYRFLYDLPKGGDLHNHQDGAVWPEWWYRVATDPAKTHGDTFYTRTKILASSSKISPVMFYITIPKWRYDGLPESAKAEYEPLARLVSLRPARRLG